MAVCNRTVEANRWIRVIFDSSELCHRNLAYLYVYHLLVSDKFAGFVELDELLKVPLLQEYRREVVADNIRTSMGSRLIHRYNWLEKDGKIYVRASYHRNFEKVFNFLKIYLFTPTVSILNFRTKH